MYHLIDYVWCVEKFDLYLDRQLQPTEGTTGSHQVYPLLTSPVFAYKNTRWVLNLYPEGLGDASSSGYVSLFIKYVSEEPESICAKVELSLLNNKNERVYLRDTGDHVYQTFIDFGYKQFVKLSELREQRGDLVTAQGSLKVFARVEFEMAGTLPASVSWVNYDLLLFKEQFKTLYETKNLCDILVRVVRTKTSHFMLAFDKLANHSSSPPVMITRRLNDISSFSPPKSKKIKVSESPEAHSPPPIFSSHTCTCNIDYSSPVSNQNGGFTDSHSCPSPLSAYLTADQHEVADDEPRTTVTEETLDIKAHKFILASRSGKFRELLKTHLIKIGAHSHHHQCSCMCTCGPDWGELDSDCFLHSSALPSSSSSSSSSSDPCLFFSTPESSSSSAPSSSNSYVDSEPSDITDLLIIETDRSPKVIEYLIRYMYTGYLDSLDCYSKDIYEISKEFKVHGLTALAREHLAKELNIANCCDYLIFCVVNNDYELNTKVQAFIQENYEAVLKTAAYKQARRKYRELFENTFGEISKKMAPSSPVLAPFVAGCPKSFPTHFQN